MAASREAVKKAVQQVRPILSVNHGEARKRALNLYKAWYRQIPYIVMDYDIPKSIQQCRAKLREEFLRHRNVTDIRVIDMLVIKGQMELKESVEIWKQKGHIMRYWKESQDPKPTDFLSKFIQGVN
uniref:NADH dehydrogenase [ubiquinone] 1 alpha subcomplex subunit 6 n=1 Tax=Glossina pallidipes TaxID=7398 RepID=A0A1A9Z2G6_GLOPL